MPKSLQAIDSGLFPDQRIGGLVEFWQSCETDIAEELTALLAEVERQSPGALMDTKRAQRSLETVLFAFQRGFQEIVQKPFLWEEFQTLRENFRNFLQGVYGGAFEEDQGLFLAEVDGLFPQMWEAIQRFQTIPEIRQRFSHDVETAMSIIRSIAENLNDWWQRFSLDSASKTPYEIFKNGFWKDCQKFMHFFGSLEYHLTDEFDFQRGMEIEPLFVRAEPLHAREAGEKGTVRFVTPKELLPMADLNEDIFHTFLANAIGNAFKRGDAETIIIAARPSGDFVEISVIDDGTGISDEVIKNKLEGDVRNVFCQGISGHESSGIGLAHLPEMLARFGAHVEIEPRSGLPTNESARKKKGLPESSQGAMLTIYLRQTSL